MSNKKFIYSAAVSLTLASQYGCSVPLCSDQGDPSDPFCIKLNSLVNGNTSSPAKFTIATRRLSITDSATVTVKISAGGMVESGTSLTVKQGTAMLSAPIPADGIVQLGSWKGTAFHPGPIDIQIVRPKMTDPSVPGNLYLTPIYNLPGTAVPGFNLPMHEPLWAGVTERNHIVAIGTKADSRSYFIDLYLNTMSPFFAGQNFPSRVVAAVSQSPSKIYLGYKNPGRANSPVDIESHPETMSAFDSIQTAESQITSLAINPQGTILSGLFGSKIVSYVMGVSLPSATPITTSVASDSRTPNPGLVASGILDADGMPDLILWDQTNNKLNVLLQKLEGTNRKFVSDPNLAEQLQAGMDLKSLVAMVSADIDSDGLDDLVYATATQVAWITNQGPGSSGQLTFAAGGTITMTGSAVSSLSIGTADGDALLDVVVTQKADHNVRVYPNKASY